MRLAALSLCLIASIATAQNDPERVVLVEAEAFRDTGGWVVDQQFMDFMGSPMLLAHGLGIPVKDAVTEVTFEQPGDYRVWVRTRDWVAPWKAPGTPGRFELQLDGQTVGTFGNEGADWHWQKGGVVTVGATAELKLHDLTGFDGRCDAVMFCADAAWTPPHQGNALATLRAQLLGWDEAPADGGEFDLVVIGGGVAGTSAAITAARLGCKVALIQDRPVLGGNGSSEVRVWPEGHTNHEPYPRIGDVVRELVRKKGRGDGNARNADIYNDRRKLDLARKEPNLTLLLEHRANAATTTDGHIDSVRAQHTRSGRRLRLKGRWFVDCTGDGVIGELAGADFEMTTEGHMGVSNLWNVGAVEKNEYQLRCECEDPDDPLSIQFVKSNQPAPFPRCPWAVDLSDKPFPGRKPNKDGKRGNANLGQLGGWFWETGFDRHPITDLERMRDQNLRAMFGAWDALKNVDGQYPNQRLKWAAFIAGKRESRRLLGDVVVTANDFKEGKPYADAAFPCTWHIDLHFPKKKFQAGHEGDEFISDYTRGKEWSYKGPYWAPYRALYSRNIDNLFMAGRDISVTHEALGAVRVMQTCGMMGEVVGMAASLCKRHDCNPRAVYTDHLDELKALMKKGTR